MAINSQHPDYQRLLKAWTVMRDTYAGEDAVKAAKERYLPATSGMHLDGLATTKPGGKAYAAYLERAIFHEIVSEAVEYFIGLMHQKPPSIELPEAMEPLRDRATTQHESLEQLLRRINEQQLVCGRFGMMADLPTNPEPGPVLPYIATYMAENILNWDTGSLSLTDLPKLNLVVLDESTWKRNSTFDWVFEKAYRVLGLGEPDANVTEGVYMQGLFQGADAAFDPSQMIKPSIQGNTLKEIPFVFINAQDILAATDKPPLLGLAQHSIAIYRGEADYRQNLFMQGQDTLVVIGGKDNDEIRTGAGCAINLKAVPGADAKFIGVNSTGLTEQRSALENDLLRAGNRAGQLIDTTSGDKESGDALQARSAAQSATLTQMAQTGAKALENLLKQMAVWMGANPDEVKVVPNKEFASKVLLAADLKDLMTAKSLGAPLSLESIHNLMLSRGMTELDYQTEMDKIEEEAPIIGTGTTVGGDPMDPNFDPNAPVKLDPKTGKPIKEAPQPKVQRKPTDITRIPKPGARPGFAPPKSKAKAKAPPKKG